MKRILVTPREGRRFGCELGELMGSLQIAGIRDYTIALERCAVLWVDDRDLLHCLKTLADADFEAAGPTPAREGVTRHQSSRLARDSVPTHSQM